ncbi:nuclear transport factor 2 family protein [Mesorhizobium sp.]|uniref:YybH family protein n=1 Tax=Mesorhizobium sp. TaxID=1871066 RepID=UPI0025FA4205|nr:nuclear transport factor 2 family protein [Mesorhizobium sp.]
MVLQNQLRARTASTRRRGTRGGLHESIYQMHKAALDQIQQRWNEASAPWDKRLLSQIYTQDALFFGLLPRLYVGRSEIEEYFGSYQLILEKVNLTLVDQNTRSLSRGLFAAQGFGDIVNYYRDGSVVKNRVRTSFVVSRINGDWQIYLHHFSELIRDK